MFLFPFALFFDVREAEAHLQECLLPFSLLRAPIGVLLLLFGQGCVHFTDWTSGL